MSDSKKRTVFINRSRQAENYCSNAISTCKYTLYSFLFKFLLDKFKNYSNVFFLFIALLQQIPHVSPTGRYTTAVPLAIILICSAFKEIFEDFKRYLEDMKTNDKKVLVMRDNNWISCKWRHVKVGDVCKITDRDFFPADLVLLSSSEPEGLCYVETSNLDGETNMKARKSPHDTVYIDSANKIREFYGVMEVELPNRHLYEFSGVLHVNSTASDIQLNQDNLLLRGSQLRNTRWIFGLVIYTGMETKLFLNARSIPFKRSNLDRQVNKQILLMLVFLFAISIVSTVTSVVVSMLNLQDHWYIGYKSSDQNVFLIFLTFVILYNNLVPISLAITIEIVKFFQDLDMYDSVTDTTAAARTSNLNEELGQIGFILSDKTGTLTMNEMVFRMCLIDDVIYGSMTDSILFATTFGSLTRCLKLDCGSPVGRFILCIMTCHTVIPSHKFPSEDEVDCNRSSLIYNASSPDEYALLMALRSVGVLVLSRTPTTLTLSVNGHSLEVQMLHVIEFSSVRQMMSVIVEFPDRSIYIFSKGADTAIFQRLSESENFFKEDTSNVLSRFAEQGLRTLCLAYREINRDEYESWSQAYQTCMTSTISDKRNMKLTHLNAEIEKELVLCGATGIEDKLQHEVADTISLFRDAGIKVWVLTGDKIETAVNIAYSCELFCDESTVFTLDLNSEEEFLSTLLTLLKEVHSTNLEGNFSLVLSGKNLEFAMKKQHMSAFMELALSCKSVMCCRVTPKQKASVVDMIKTNTKKLTLAVGDGANDVGMIQAAHVGVGIHGREGNQAACASDYSIGQFRFLKKLLFVHGVWNYRRICKVILYSYYKNICLYVIELWFAFFSAFSGQVLFERWTIGLYNLIFTAAPPIVLGMFDRCPEPDAIFKYPDIYKYTQDKQDFNVAVFWTWILNGVYHSAVLFFGTYAATYTDVVTRDGKTFGSHIYVGCFVYTYVVTTVCAKALLMMDCWTNISSSAVWLSILSWFVFLPIYSFAWLVIPFAEDIFGIGLEVYKSPVFWLCLLLVPTSALLADLIYAAVQRSYFPTVLQTVQRSEYVTPERLVPFKRRRIKTERAISRKMAALKSIFSRRDASLSGSNRPRTYRGFAFSQEENGVIAQSQLIRSYTTTNDIADDLNTNQEKS